MTTAMPAITDGGRAGPDAVDEHAERVDGHDDGGRGEQPGGERAGHLAPPGPQLAAQPAQRLRARSATGSGSIAHRSTACR